jgi:hypothetical protein
MISIVFTIGVLSGIGVGLAAALYAPYLRGKQ